MASISWKNAVSGDFSTGANWTGGVAPGAQDTAIIAASGIYVVDVTVPTAVAGIVLDQSNVGLVVEDALSVGLLTLQAGYLQLDDAALSGTVRAVGGRVVVGQGTSTFNGVTFEGYLDPDLGNNSHSVQTTLVAENSLTLTGANGSGSGSALLRGGFELDNVASLDNATITVLFGSTLINDQASTVTFGSHLNFDSIVILDSATNLINNGVFSGNAYGGTGTFTNNGTWNVTSNPFQYFVQNFSNGPDDFVNNGTLDVGASLAFFHDGAGADVNNGLITFSTGGPNVGVDFYDSFTNNGTIDIGSGDVVYLNYQNLNKASAQGAIALSSGTLSINGSLTTAQLLAVYKDQHVTGTGSFSVGAAGSVQPSGVVDVLNNEGAKLDIGIGTKLGVLAPNLSSETIIGGVIIDHGGNGQLGQMDLENLTFKSADTSLSFAQGSILDNVNLSGASTLTVVSGLVQGGTLTGVNTLNLGDVELGGATIRHSGNAPLAISADGTITVDPDQSLQNANIACPYGTFLTGGSGTAISLSDTTQFNVATTGRLSFNDGSGGDWISAAGITTAGLIQIGDRFKTTFTNTGTIMVSAGGTLEIGPYGTLINQGVIDVDGGTLDVSSINHLVGDVTVTDGTIILAGSLTVGSLFRIDHAGSQEVVTGTLDLRGRTTVDDRRGAGISLGNGAVVTDGTLGIAAGVTLAAVGDVTIDTGLVNQGTINFTDDIDNSYDPKTYKITGAVTGAGTISIGGSGGNLTLDSSVASGQTIAFLGSQTELQLSAVDTNSFAGTLAGFAPQDSIYITAGSDVTSAVFAGDTIKATRADGSILTLQTATALTGSITVFKYNLHSMLVYDQPAMSVHDWMPATLSAAADTLPADHGAVRMIHFQDAEPTSGWFGALHSHVI